MAPLSSDEQHLFDCLRDYTDSFGCSPGIRELEQATGVRARYKVQKGLDSLKRKGYIDWQPGKKRSYRVLVRGVPILGVIQAGAVVEHPIDLVQWATVSGVPYRSNYYALCVLGDSMIDAHICEGDLVIVRPKPDLWSLRRDAIAVVWVEGEGATLKYTEYKDGEVLLKPANRKYPIRKTTPEQIELQGVVLSVHRHYDTL